MMIKGEIMKRIIFFDIDGTLLNENTKTIPNSCINALYKAKENGHLLIVNTGRPYTGISQIIKDLPFDGYICGCGTHIIYHNEEIYYHALSQDERKRIIKLNYQYDIDSVLEGKEGSYYKTKYNHPFIQNMMDMYKNECLKAQSYSIDDTPIFDKFTSWYVKDVDIEGYKKELEEDYTIIQRDIDFVEIVPKACSKAIGIQKLIDYLHMPIESTMSVGDSTNDLSMLTYTFDSIAMGNSNPVLFDQVTFITTNIDDDGIYNALKHYKLVD